MMVMMVVRIISVVMPVMMVAIVMMVVTMIMTVPSCHRKHRAASEAHCPLAAVFTPQDAEKPPKTQAARLAVHDGTDRAGTQKRLSAARKRA